MENQSGAKKIENTHALFATAETAVLSNTRIFCELAIQAGNHEILARFGLEVMSQVNAAMDEIQAHKETAKAH